MWIKHCAKDVEISGTRLDFPDRIVSGCNIRHASIALFPSIFSASLWGHERRISVDADSTRKSQCWVQPSCICSAVSHIFPYSFKRSAWRAASQCAIDRTTYMHQGIRCRWAAFYIIATIMSSIYSNRPIVCKAGSRPDLKFLFDLFVTRFSPQPHGPTVHPNYGCIFEPRVIRFDMSRSPNGNDNRYWTIDASMADLHTILFL